MNTATPPPPPPKEQEQEAHTAPPPPTTPQARLAYLYEDVTRLSQIAAPDIILHPADRDVHLQLPHHPHEQHPHPRPPLVGLAAAQQHEDELVARTGGTLRMDVESITVAADGGFGCVMGVLRVGGCCFLPFRNSGMEDGSGSGAGAGAGAGVGAGVGVDSEPRRKQESMQGGGCCYCGDGEDEDRDDGGANVGREGDGGKGKGKGDKKSDKDGVDGFDSRRTTTGKASFGPRRRIEMPFCGVWRFDSMGRAVEHWENAADPETLVRWLRGE